MAESTFGALARSGVLELGDGYRTRRDQLAGDGFRIIRVADVRDNRVYLDGDDFVQDSYAAKIGPKTARAGDVLLTTKGTVGRVAIMPETDEACVYSPQLCYFRVAGSEVLDGRFLSYWLQSSEFSGQASYLQGNTDMAPYISLSDLRSTRIHLRPLSEQRAIADVLGALDDKIAANTKLAATADDLAATLYARAAAEVGVTSASSRLSPLLGGTPSRGRVDFWDGECPWVSARDVTGAPRSVILDTEEHITEFAVASTKAKPLPVGSVILTARGTVGAVARLGVQASFNQSCYGFVPGVFGPAVLFHVVRSFSDQARSLAHGSVFDTITMRTFEHLIVPDFTAPRAQDLESDLAPVLAQVTSAVEENQRLAAMRDALLPALMSGRLTVDEAADRAGV